MGALDKILGLLTGGFGNKLLDTVMNRASIAI